MTQITPYRLSFTATSEA